MNQHTDPRLLKWVKDRENWTPTQIELSKLYYQANKTNSLKAIAAAVVITCFASLLALIGAIYAVLLEIG